VAPIGNAVTPSHGAAAAGFRLGFGQNMLRLLVVFSTLFLILTHDARPQPLTVDPESIVPLPDKFDMEIPAPDVPPEITCFLGAWTGTWHDDRHILVVERVKPDGEWPLRVMSAVFAMSATSPVYLRPPERLPRRNEPRACATIANTDVKGQLLK